MGGKLAESMQMDRRFMFMNKILSPDNCLPLPGAIYSQSSIIGNARGHIRSFE